MWRAHDASGADVTMAVIRNPNPANYNGIRAGRDRVLLGFVPKGHREETWHFVGVQITRKSVFAGLRDGEPAETVAGLYREMAVSTPGRIRIWPVETSFLDVGTAVDYLEAARALGGAPSGSVFWPGVTVDPGASLTDCVVAGPVHLPRGFTATSSVIVPASVTRPEDVMDYRDGVGVFPLRASRTA
jgi:NDP-sugar pyrophosphorylase family protein